MGGELGGLAEFRFKGDNVRESPFEDLVLVLQSFPGLLLELLEVVVLSLEGGAVLGEVLINQVNELLGEDEEVGGGVRVIRYGLNQCLGQALHQSTRQWI